MFKTFFIFVKLYIKSLALVLKAGKVNAVLLLLIIPFQALLPAVLIASSNSIINAVAEKTGENLILLLTVWAIAFLLSNILTPVYTTVQGFLTDKLTQYLNISLMNKSKEITSLSVFEDSRFYDDIEILSSEAGWRPVNLLVFGASIISSSITAISMLVLLADFSPLIALLMFLAIIPQSLIFYRIQQEAFEVLVSNSADSRKLSYYSSLLLSKENIKEVQLYNLYDFFIEKYTDSFQTIKKDLGKNRLKKLAASVFFLSFTVIISIFIFSRLIEKAFSGSLLIGSILIFSSSIIYTTQSISRLVEDSSLLYDTLLYMQKYFNFLSIQEEKNKTSQEFKTEPFKCIEFKNLCFKYPLSEGLVLDNISFSVKQGEKIAVVGENGSGKTTLIKVFCRFYKPASGKILFDNTDIKDIDILDYRKRIGAVFQDFARFTLTLRENTALSSLDKQKNNKLVLNALKKAGLSFELSKGEDSDYNLDSDLNLETLLGTSFEGGRDVSGGQWQKIAIARAFFGSFDILILDEPTASIDAKAEFQIYEKFLALTKGKTVFFVTHRLSTVKRADKVLLLKKGKIYGFAPHEVLIKTNAYYKELYNMQAEAYRE